jgi:hypothetical protein
VTTPEKKERTRKADRTSKETAALSPREQLGYRSSKDVRLPKQQTHPYYLTAQQPFLAATQSTKIAIGRASIRADR